MKKKFIVLIISSQLLHSMDTPPYNHKDYDCFLKGMVQASRDARLSLSVKKKVLERFIDDAPQLGFHTILDWVPAVYPKFSCNEIDEVIMKGNTFITQEYTLRVGEDTITDRRNFYRKKIRKNKALFVSFFKSILDNKQCMVDYLINTRHISPAFPPLFLKPCERTDKQALLNNDQLQYIFLDTIVRFQHTLLRKIIEIQKPGVYKNAFLEGRLPLHLAVQINWYKIVQQILNSNSSFVWTLNSFGHLPEFYLDRENNRMKNLLEFHKQRETVRKN